MFAEDTQHVLNKFEDTHNISTRSRGSEIISCTPYAESYKSLL